MPLWGDWQEIVTDRLIVARGGVVRVRVRYVCGVMWVWCDGTQLWCGVAVLCGVVATIVLGDIVK